MTLRYAPKKLEAGQPRYQSARENRLASRLKRLLKPAGIQLNGPDPRGPQFHDPRAIIDIVSRGSLGLGDTYMEGNWDCPRLDETISRALAGNIDLQRNCNRPALLLLQFRARLLNLQKQRRAHQVAEQHYDIGNDLYRAMLGSSMTYSCGYWKDAGRTGMPDVLKQTTH